MRCCAAQHEGLPTHLPTPAGRAGWRRQVRADWPADADGVRPRALRRCGCVNRRVASRDAYGWKTRAAGIPPGRRHVGGCGAAGHHARSTSCRGSTPARFPCRTAQRRRWRMRWRRRPARGCWIPARPPRQGRASGRARPQPAHPRAGHRSAARAADAGDVHGLALSGSRRASPMPPRPGRGGMARRSTPSCWTPLQRHQGGQRQPTSCCTGARPTSPRCWRPRPACSTPAGRCSPPVALLYAMPARSSADERGAGRRVPFAHAGCAGAAAG